MKKLFITTALLSASLSIAHAEELFELKDQYLSETMPKKIGAPAEMIMKNYQVGKVKVQTNLALWGEEGVYGTVNKSPTGYFKIEPDTALDKWRFEIDAVYGFFRNCGQSVNKGFSQPIAFYSENNEKFTLEIKDCSVLTEKVAKTATENNFNMSTYTVESDGSNITVSQNSRELFNFEKGKFGKLNKVDMNGFYMETYTYVSNIKLTSK